MENNLLKNTFKNMKYSTYKKLDAISFHTMLYGCVNPVVVAAINYPVFECILVGYILLAEAYYITTTITDCEQYTKDIKEITNLYNEFINNYAKFNNTLELNHPLEIYTLYNYMLKHGYLSNENYFSYGCRECKDIKSLLGVNIIAGEGVCRHISSTLNDIYTKLDLNASTATAYMNQEQMTYMLLKANLSEFEKQLKNSTEKEDQIMLEEAITKLKEIKTNNKPKFTIKQKNANHMINLVSKDNIGYIIDPTNEQIHKKIIVPHEEDILKSYVASSKGAILKLTKEKGNYEQKRNILLLPNSTNEEDKKIISNTNSICFRNIDMLKRFRDENKELYSEINDKLVNVKKKKLIK